MEVSCLQEAHFSSVLSQSNIYGLATLCTPKNQNKVLITSLKRRVYCVEYTRNMDHSLIPSTREVPFTYIPGSAEIISIDAFNKYQNDRDSFVGITLIKNSDNGSNQYLNIYSDWEPDNGENDLEKLQGCLTLQLDYIPYKLTHSELKTANGKETVWLLSGSDCKVHLYREDPINLNFSEQPINNFFPEFNDLPSIVYCMEIMNKSSKRITAIGCENGLVRVVVVNTKHEEISVKNVWDLQLDSPITSIKLFFENVPVNTPEFLKENTEKHFIGKSKDEPLHMLVVSSLEKSVVYRDILHKVNKNMIVLQNSDSYDCPTSACIADLDMDGVNEIILGTYGQQLLIFKWNNCSQCYDMLWNRAFSHPLLALSCMDFIGDGVNELLVLSTKGLHILQYDPENVVSLCLERLKNVALRFNKEIYSPE